MCSIWCSTWHRLARAQPVMAGFLDEVVLTWLSEIGWGERRGSPSSWEAMETGK